VKLFGSSGIRGLANVEITPELALKIGSAVGSQYKRIVLGTDPRTTNRMLASALASGAMASGADVYDAGMTATPTLAHAARNYDCGMIVTASHNPPEYNGVKLWNPDGTSFTTPQMEETERRILDEDFDRVGWSDVGKMLTHDNAVREHMDSIISGVGNAGLTVVVDCGCGAACNITPFLLREMGCKVITLNAQADGFFPARNPEPVEKSLSLLIDTVKGMGADLGIAHDGDADRMMAVDSLGRFLTGDVLLAIFGKAAAKTRMVVPVNASLAVEDYISGVEIVRTSVGDVFISEELKLNGGEFGGEPSGTWVFPEQSFCPDGIFAAAKLVALAAEEGLAARADKVPRYPLMRGGLMYARDKKAEVLGALDGALRGLECKELSDMDGWRLVFEDGWVLVRPSGTEPKIRITAEARSKDETRKLYDLAYDVVKNTPGVEQ